MKKIVIVGAGTAGLAAAAMMKSYWGSKVDITLIYDKSRGNISVGESTTPIFRLLLSHLGISTKQLIKDIGGKATIKLGINLIILASFTLTPLNLSSQTFENTASMGDGPPGPGRWSFLKDSS